MKYKITVDKINEFIIKEKLGVTLTQQQLIDLEDYYKSRKYWIKNNFSSFSDTNTNMIRNAIEKLKDTFSTKKSEAKKLGEMFFHNDFRNFLIGG